MTSLAHFGTLEGMSKPAASKKGAPKRSPQHRAAKKPIAKSPASPKSPKTSPGGSSISLQPELAPALNAASAQLGWSRRKIVNQALAEFLAKATPQLRHDLEGTLQKLRAYRSKDPDFESAIERFAEAEAEATRVNEDAHEGRPHSSSEQSLSEEIRELIHG